MCCRKSRRKATLHRHNDVLLTLNRFARTAGASTHIEPRPFDNSNRKPDLSITFFDQVFTDVTIIQPDAPSKSHSPITALSNAEQSKCLKYSADITAIGATFLPAAASSYGVLGVSLCQLISRLASIAHDSGRMPESIFKQSLVDELSENVPNQAAAEQSLLPDCQQNSSLASMSPKYCVPVIEFHRNTNFLLF